MIRFTDPAKDKLLKELHKLGVTEKKVTETIRDPDEILYDSQTDRYVAVSWSHQIAAVYQKDGDILVITVIYSSMLKDIVDRRRRSGRWI